MEKTHAVDAVGDKLSLIRRAVPAIAVGMLVRRVILQRSNGKRTPLGRGGWQTIDMSELQTSDNMETLASVIPFDARVAPSVAEPRPIIDVADIPPGQPQRPHLTVIDRLIDIEDIPAS